MMTLEQAYDWMFCILDEYWNKTKQRDLGEMLGEFSRSLFIDKKPADPAAWQDWVNAVQKVTLNESITRKDAYQAMLLLLQDYNDNQGFDLAEVIDHFRQQNTLYI